MNSSYHESSRDKHAEIAFDLDPQHKRRKQLDEESVDGPRYAYRIGEAPIPLTLPEYKLIRFLAAKPYRAFSRERIVRELDSGQFPITDASLDELVRSLRAKLGVFSDYVQTVPYIGFRFKP